MTGLTDFFKWIHYLIVKYIIEFLLDKDRTFEMVSATQLRIGIGVKPNYSIHSKTIHLFFFLNNTNFIRSFSY